MRALECVFFNSTDYEQISVSRVRWITLDGFLATKLITHTDKYSNY